MHRSPEESSLSVLESKTEKRVTFRFERPRQGNQTWVRKTYVKKRLQETRDDLPKTEPNGSKIFHLMNCVQTGRSFHSVKWINKAVTRRRRQRMQNKRGLFGDSKHSWSERQWRSDPFVSRCQTKDEKWTFRHALLGWPTLVVNWTWIYQSKTKGMKTKPLWLGRRFSRYHVLINGWRDTRSTIDGVFKCWSNESSMIDHGIPGPQFNAKEEKSISCFYFCLKALVLLVGPFGLLVPRRAGDGGQRCGSLKTLNVLTSPFVPWVRFWSPRSHQSEGTNKKC